MPQFRSKGESLIDAIQFTGGLDNAQEIYDWLGPLHLLQHFSKYQASSPEHLMVRECRQNVDDRIDLNHWIIKSSNEGVYACAPDTFDWLYEPVQGPYEIAEIPYEEQRAAIGKIVWDTSRRDEGTISATGANIIADALLAAGYVSMSDSDTQARLPLLVSEPFSATTEEIAEIHRKFLDAFPEWSNWIHTEDGHTEPHGDPT
jgi:hypothetical protein